MLERLSRELGDEAPESEYLLRRYNRFFPFDEQKDLLVEPQGDPRELALAILGRYREDIEADGLGDLMVVASLRMMIAEKGIAVQDRTSALNQVEVRHPLHDVELLRFSRTIPAQFKNGEAGGTEKAVFKAAFRDLLPEGIDTREKGGYPSYYWNHGEIDALKERLLSPASLQRSGLLRPEAVRRVLEADARSAKKSAGKRTWGLLVLQGWCACHLDGDVDVLAERG